MKKGTKKPIIFHADFEAQRKYSLEISLNMTPAERLAEMYRLNRKIYGKRYGVISKTTELYCAKPGETVEDFYKRINSND